ncbi:MAG: CAP domain-containing protein [Candidatus Pacebacteria bacterium]|nr:CAP domain-containing protein [Candidatus Paceibacterota bacterium]
MIKNFLSRVKTLGFWLKKLFIPCNDNNFRPKILEGKYLVYILLLACFLRLSTFLFFWQLPNTSFFADISRMVLIDSLNDERAGLKLGTLKENNLLNQASLLKANDMMQNGYFSHTSPAGITPWYWFKKVGYNYRSAGENLGIGFVDSAELHQAWNESPSHKANLVNANYKDVGISFVEGNFQGSKTTIVVQMFGALKSVPQTKPPTQTTQTSPTTGNPTAKPQNSVTEANQGTANLVDVFSTTASGVAGNTTILPEVLGDSPSSFLIVDVTSGLIFTSTTTMDLGGQNQEPKLAGIWGRVLKFFAKDYNSLTQKIVLVFLVINIVALILNIIIKIFVQHYDLILKATLISLALILLLIIGPKEIVSLIQPYAQIF